MLTEAEVQRSFRKMFAGKDRSPEVFEKAERLVDGLRDESPLKYRLEEELEELRQLDMAGA